MDRRVSHTLKSSAQVLTPDRTSNIFRSNSVSQSTQLLQHALAPAPQSQEHGRDSGLASPTDGNFTAIDFSLDSRVIPARPATPRYHLEISSLKSPESSGERVLGENEKLGQINGELVGACRIGLPTSPKNKVDPIHLGPGSELFHQHGDRPLTASAGKAIGTRSPSFHFPPTTAAKSMPVENRQYRRSPSPASQDSFGGSVSQDPAELYLASAKQFNVPLSDLGETPTQEVIHSPTDPGMTLPDASEHKEFLEVAMREYEAQRANRATLIHRPNILVAATPSNSDCSLGTSQHEGGFSFHNGDPELAGQESRFEFDGSSSFDKMLDRDLTDVPDPTPEPTQPKEIQSTQVESIVGDGILTTPPWDSEQRSPPFEWIAPSPSAAVASSNPRSLLRMVHPGNQYRIAMMRHLAGAVEPRSCVTNGVEMQPSRMEETQPCHIDESPYSHALPSARSTLRRSKPAEFRPLTCQRVKEDEDDEPEDALDVVPDSEPLRAGPSTLTPTYNHVVRQVSPKKPFRPCSPISEHESGDIVPDSLEGGESETDIPLAIEVAARNTRQTVAPTEAVAFLSSKTRTASTVPTKGTLPALEKRKRKPSATTTTNGMNSRVKASKMEPVEIPTSLPEQDLRDQTSSSGQLPAPPADVLPFKKSRWSKKSEASRARHTSTTHLPATKPVAGQKRCHPSDTESAEEWAPYPAEDEGAAHLDAQKEEEEESEFTDDHDADPPPPPPPKLDASQKKRRRTKDENQSRGMSKASTSARNTGSETPAVVTRSVKRLRSGVSSTRGLMAEPATAVFALWKLDGHYYSGVIHSRARKNRYLVMFDDGTEDEVEPKNMRYRVLRAKDRVISTQDGLKGEVGDVSHADSEGWVELVIDHGKAISTRRATFCDIRIANRTIQSQWQERMVVPENIVTRVKPTALLDATPSKQSVISTTSGKSRRELVKTGFVVTINPKNGEPIQTKEDVIDAIKRHGGQVFDDWSRLFTMEGKHSQSNKRWIATPQDFRWESKVNLDRVFLLSDDAHQKPKFLLALALGIPCLSFEWLTKEGELSSDWQPFLLPAGYSDTLGARVSQLVDLDWGNCTEHLTDIMASRVPIKLFSQKTVLCVGPDLVPLPPSRARKNATEEASRYVPWIILCMGATKVEAVIDTKQVTPSHMQSFDYVIVKDREILGSAKLGNKATVGDVDWVKECLVSSRLSTPELN